MGDAAADHGINIYVKVGVLGEQLQFLVENFQTFLRDFVRVHVVDGNLQPLESGVVKALDAIGDQQISVGDEAGDHAIRADSANDVVEFGMHERLAAGNRNDRGAERTQLVDAAIHFVERDGLREIVELVAVSAGQVAAAHGNDVRQQRMVGRSQCTDGHVGSTQIAVQSFGAAAQGCDD